MHTFEKQGRLGMYEGGEVLPHLIPHTKANLRQIVE